MDSWKSEQVRKIWQRVQANSPPTPREHTPVCLGMGELVGDELRDSQLLAALSRRFSGQNAAILRKMAAEDQAHHNILKGICTMTDETPLPSVHKREAVPAKVLLQRIYGRKCQRLAAYQQQTGQFSAAMEKISQQESNHCQQLLFLLGKMK